jgi:hypothetical protein
MINGRGPMTRAEDAPLKDARNHLSLDMSHACSRSHAHLPTPERLSHIHSEPHGQPVWHVQAARQYEQRV